MTLGGNRWGKSGVRVSKLVRGSRRDEFHDITVQMLLEGDVAAAHTEGDNSGVVPTDTMKNTIYALAQEHLGPDLESFGEVLCEHLLGHDGITLSTVVIEGRHWHRESDRGFTGGSSERRVARVSRGSRTHTGAGIDGLVVLKTGGSAFSGFPRDAFTILPEAEDRILATSVSADWTYSTMPGDTVSTWEQVRSVLLERFFADWSASVQHQGYLMGEAVLEVVDEIEEISLRMPNQHHVPFSLTRFGMDDHGVVFQPVSEPYGDIAMTIRRS